MPELALMKVKEVAANLRISRDPAYALAAAGQFPAVRIGRLIRVARRALDEFTNTNRYYPE